MRCRSGRLTCLGVLLLVVNQGEWFEWPSPAYPGCVYAELGEGIIGIFVMTAAVAIERIAVCRVSISICAVGAETDTAKNFL